jgi:hypothetical protein
MKHNGNPYLQFSEDWYKVRSAGNELIIFYASKTTYLYEVPGLTV